jgi:hypothetical protein
MLFSGRSILTMLHGIVFGGVALMALAAALFAASSMMKPEEGSDVARSERSRTLAALMAGIAVVLWMTVISGTYIIFPPYRAPPPQGVLDLVQYPRARLLANPDTAWLHAFAMECKEHMPWIAAMLATAAGFIGIRYRSVLLTDPLVRRLTATLLGICFALVGFAALLGTFVNKVAPLE